MCTEDQGITPLVEGDAFSLGNLEVYLSDASRVGPEEGRQQQKQQCERNSNELVEHDTDQV
jgi:hypothetical protein